MKKVGLTKRAQAAWKRKFETAELKKLGMRPRTGAVPENPTMPGPFPNYWRYDQAILVKPRGCSPTLASAIEGYNAAPTDANLHNVRVLIAMQ